MECLGSSRLWEIRDAVAIGVLRPLVLQQGSGSGE
jgi:hypothetical protein